MATLALVTATPPAPSTTMNPLIIHVAAIVALIMGAEVEDIHHTIPTRVPTPHLTLRIAPSLSRVLAMLFSPSR
jgi:hypothetical protein